MKSRTAFANTLAQYNELARKFLLEAKFQAANFLLGQFFEANLSLQEKQLLRELEVQSELAFSADIDRI